MPRLRRQLITSLVLQGSGAAATLGAAMWLGTVLGPEQQGQFNQLKSLVELGAALAMLGMPQALYVFAQQGRLSLALARRTAAWIALLGLPVGALLAVFMQPSGHGAGLVLALAAAVALASLQGQWRALALLGPSATAFNLATIAPQWALLGLAAGVVASGGLAAPAVAAGLVVVWALACVAAAAALHETGLAPAVVPAVLPVTKAASPPPLWRGLVHHGMATWLTTSLAAAAIVLLQQAAGAASGPAGLGRISLAILLAQIPLTPLNYALPLLLRHRLQGPAGGGRLGGAPWAIAPMVGLAGAAWGLGQWRSDFGLGQGYEGLHRLVAWLLLAGAADTLTRLHSVDAQAEGRPWRSTAAEAARLALLAAGAAWVLMSGPAAPQALEALAQCWLAGALAACAVMVVLMQARPRSP